MPAMLGCSTVCPNCKHKFTCCTPEPICCANNRRSVHGLSGGGCVAMMPSYPSPEVPPSLRVTLVLPSIPMPVRARGRSEADLEKLAATVRALNQSGWYYPDIDQRKSAELLKDTKEGTFLVRDSSDPRYLFSLSVQTANGPVSVRLYYVDGYFRLNAERDLERVMPIFPGVIELVQHYVMKKRKSRLNDANVWVDPDGKFTSMYLDQPLRKDEDPRSLKHLSRRAVFKNLPNASLLNIAKLELPASLAAYLAEYPYFL